MKRRTRNGGSGKRRKAPKTGNGVSQLSLMDLPTALLHEIFFKLPVSSIINAKFVCTELYKTLSDPEFAVNYTKSTRFTSILSIEHRLTHDLESPIFILTEISEDYEYFETALTPRIPDFVDLSSSLSLRRTCDGLLCLHLMKPRAEVAYICNPLTGDSLALPAVHKPKRAHPLSLVYGLGFCQSANKYKVLRVICDSDEPGNGYGEILTIGVDSGWRSLANPAVPMPEFLLDLNSLNGVLHWLFFAGDRSSCIYSFDLGEERLGQTPGPPGVVLNCERMRLVLLSNQLCLVDPSKRNTLVIWKMKEHASGNSWTKDIILSKSFPRRVRFRGHWPLAISRNGEIILSDHWNTFVVSYNPEKRTCTKIKVFEMERFAYTPSLLSLQELISGRHWRNMNVLSN